MQIARTLPVDPHAPAEARRALDALSSKVPQGVLEDARLVVTELVTNSIKHSGTEGRGSMGLAFLVSGDRLHIEVADAGRGFEPEMEPRPRADLSSGFGLFLVDRLADRWGVKARNGTRVWAELDLAARRSEERAQR